MDNYIHKLENNPKEMDNKLMEPVILGLYQENKIEKKTCDCLLQFISVTEIGKLMKMSMNTQEKNDTVLKWIYQKLDELKEIYEKEDSVSFYVPGCEKQLALKKQQALNEKKYMKILYEKTNAHLFIYGICKNGFEILKDLSELKVCYKQYGKDVMFDGGIYSPSPVMELVTSNVHKGNFYKRIPKDLSNKIEYDYDGMGRLIMRKWYRDNKNLYSLDFFLYSQTQIFCITYYCGKEKISLLRTRIQNYQDELIVSYECAEYNNYPDMERVWGIEAETYSYSDGILRMCWKDSYFFPDKYYSGLGPRMQYLFESDENGYLNGYYLKEWWGDKERETVYREKLLEISEKKRKDTGREAGRWRRPNYFIK